jgi:hypothetical protein
VSGAAVLSLQPYADSFGARPDVFLVVTGRGDVVGAVKRGTGYRAQWSGPSGTGWHSSRRAALAAWQSWADDLASKLAP